MFNLERGLAVARESEGNLVDLMRDTDTTPSSG
jgi:hypothetical protein